MYSHIIKVINKIRTEIIMKKLILFILLLNITVNTNAALLDNSGYTTDTDTLLDWLDLSSTANIQYSSVATFFDTIEGGGWRYATSNEVANLFSISFVGYYDTVSNGYSLSTDGAYANQGADVATFQNLFGTVTIGATTSSYGLYEDENNILRMMGANSVTDGSTTVISSNFNGDYNLYRDTPLPAFGTYLVRTNITIDTDGDGIPDSTDPCIFNASNNCAAANVLETSSIYLLMIGLFGLISINRNKS